jgi:arylsulfatase A-like enzyme
LTSTVSLSLGPGSRTPPSEPVASGDEESGGRSPWLTVLVVVVLVAAGLTATWISNRDQVPAAGVTDNDQVRVRNAIVFLVDDMSDFSCAEAGLYLPRSSRWLLDQGTCYENATSSTPVCCPARGQIQTGQYSHNNRVVSQVAARNLVVRDTIQHDLDLVGVHTYGIGKNLNGIEASEYAGPHGRDTGFTDFDFWNAYKGEPGTFKLYDDDGNRYTPTDGLSTTETNGAFLDRYLDEKLASGEQFYAYDAFVAPHKQSGGFGKKDLPPPSVKHANAPVPPFRYAPERDASDKLPIFQGARFKRSYYERLFTAKVRALYDVDDQMADAMEKIEAAGVMDETAVIFTSDNGYTDRGQANWEGKSIPYPAATNIPMLAWFPGRPPAVENKPVALIDIAATLYDVFGVVPGHQLDGHSLLGDYRREHVFAEFYNENSGLSRRESGPLASNLRSWRVVKEGRRAYVEWYGAGGQVVFDEFYADPGMTRNLLSDAHRDERPPDAVLDRFRRLMEHYGTCQGTTPQGSPQPCP